MPESPLDPSSPDSIIAAEPMHGGDVAAFAEAARSQAADLWPAPAAAGAGGPACLDGLWSAAAQQGWLELADAGALAAATALVRELGRLACPLPVLDAYVAARLFAADTGLVKRIADGSVRVAAAVAGGADFGAAAAADGAPLLDAPGATHVLLLLPVGAGTAELRPVLGTEPLPGLAAPTGGPPGPAPPKRVRN